MKFACKNLPAMELFVESWAILGVENFRLVFGDSFGYS